VICGHRSSEGFVAVQVHCVIPLHPPIRRNTPAVRSVRQSPINVAPRPKVAIERRVYGDGSGDS